MNGSTDVVIAGAAPAGLFQAKEEQDAKWYEPEFVIRPGDVAVVGNGRPQGSSGMPKYGRIQVPDELPSIEGLGVGRSVTAVLQITPEAAVGGPIGLVPIGHTFVLDFANRRIDVDLTQEELAERRAQWKAPVPEATPARGFAKPYVGAVTQDDTGCDFGLSLPVNPSQKIEQEPSR